MGTQKPMPVNEPEYFMVAFRQLDGRNRGNALEAGKAGHPASMNGASPNQTTCGFVDSGKLVSGNGS